MADPIPPPETKRFPYFTASISFVTFFAFVGLMMLAYNSPNYLSETKIEPKADPATKLSEVRARNQAILDGSGAKMPVSTATAELLGSLKNSKSELPFPAPPPLVPAAPEPKKK